MKNTLLLFSIFILNSTHAQVSDFKKIDFNKADKIAKLQEGHGLDNLPVLAHQLTSELDSEVEKFRAIYMWVCNNIKGDISQHNIVSRKRNKYKNDSISYLKWNNEYKKKTFKTLLKHQKTMCTGYAYLIKELCFIANIESEIIDGYGRTVNSNIFNLDMANHSWNAVKLNNKWYLCDATWSSGYSLENSIFIKDYNDGYFLTDPILFARNHFPLDKKWFLDNILADTEFVAAPLVYGETFKHQIIPLSPATMHIKTTTHNEISFSFKTPHHISKDRINLVQYYGNNEKIFPIYAIRNENDLISFDYTFEKKGTYDVHLKIDNDIVATYIIQIPKIPAGSLSLSK
ncbi:MAG: transglutaminase domain-containing protein [Gelidibacter sp.]